MRDAGFRVYAPILFGLPDAGNIEKPTLVRILSLCVSREFTLLAANKSSPVTALGRLAHQECDGRGVGAIGMCLTGGFALSMALDPVVLAPLLAQPGLPATRPGAKRGRRAKSRPWICPNVFGLNCLIGMSKCVADRDTAPLSPSPRRSRN